MISFVCQDCGFESKKWVGKCQNCNTWNTMVEREVTKGRENKLRSGQIVSGIPEIEILSDELSVDENSVRIKSNIQEFDNAIGGGFIPNSIILIGGEPGIGKSTLLLQLGQLTSKSNKKVVYVSGEESVPQVASRAKRMGIIDKDNKNMSVISSGSISNVLKILNTTSLDFLFVDSVQTMFVDFLDNSPGTINQIRAVATELISFCKSRNVTLVLIGHITKDGSIAGPKLLEHLVDCVMYFEGESRNNFRILRTTKNRFGPTNEIGVFEMRSNGLNEISNPSSFFVQSNHMAAKEIIFPAIEGTRCVLVPTEALVARSYTVSPRRSVVGWDSGRLSMVLAIAQTHCGNFTFHDKDVYLSMALGFKTNESANDLAVMSSIILAYNRRILKKNIVILGELSLNGTARQVPFTEARVKEAKKLSYKTFILPKSNATQLIKDNEKSLEIYLVENIKQLLETLESLMV